VVGFDEQGRPDSVRRILTFTSSPLESELEIAGPIQVTLYAASTNTDTDFIVKISEQFPQEAGTTERAPQPRSKVVTKGWLRASHRAIDPVRSKPNAPWYVHESPEPIEPAKTYKYEIAVMPTAHLFKKGSRIRLELANGDSQLTEFVFQHEYTPDKVGCDTIYYGPDYPSNLLLPIITR
jgi:predicted acyl esterase